MAPACLRSLVLSACGLLLIGAVVGCAESAPYEVAQTERQTLPETPLFPGATRPGTHVYHSSGVVVEYPEDWMMGVGDLGTTDRFGMFLRSPAGTSVEIIFATREINVMDPMPEDEEDLGLLLTEWIRYATPAPAP